jgi:Uncharacterized conserved protein
MALPDTQFYQGSLSHKRLTPVEHEFSYQMFQIWLNVKTPEVIDSLSRWWSSKSFNLVRFDRQNYLPGDKDLYQQVCDLIEQRTSISFDGDVFLLGSLSYWGYCYNPASFFACYENEVLKYFICEIHNTPWGERFCYVHDLTNNDQSGEATKHVAEFEKDFHVSPFMPMALQYEWRYSLSAKRIMISMNLKQNDERVFNATLNLQGQPLDAAVANRLPFKYPFMCIKVLLSIYWQALKLWFKRVPFYSHPKKNPTTIN